MQQVFVNGTIVGMKKALVLAGGGTKGAYQAGAIRALCEMGMDDWDIVTGTSVGAMHAALVVQKDYDYLQGIYERLAKEEIFNGTLPLNLSLNELIEERKEIGKTLMQVVRDKGVDISPLKKNIHDLFDAEKFFSSHTDFGCITAREKGHAGVYVTKDMMHVHPEEWILASCSAYPAFPAAEIDGVSYVDGGYFDNVPVDFALRLGADEAVVIDLSAVPYHPHYLSRSNIRYLFPHSDPGDFLDFSKEKISHLRILGYNDAWKMYDKYSGFKYTFERYARPRFFMKWYVEVEKLETRIKLASNINEQFRSDEYITRRLKERMHLPVLSEQDYFDGMMDALMDLCDCDEEHIYTLKEARDVILITFADTWKEDYVYKPTLNVQQLAQFTKSLDTKGVVARLIHENLYPDHQLFGETTTLTLYPFEKAMADFVYWWMKELKEE